MRFYKQPADQQPHGFYCGVDLHARCMYLCILDQAGQTLLHANYPADPRAFLDAVAPFRAGLPCVIVPDPIAFGWPPDRGPYAKRRTGGFTRPLPARRAAP